MYRLVSISWILCTLALILFVSWLALDSPLEQSLERLPAIATSIYGTNDPNRSRLIGYFSRDWRIPVLTVGMVVVLFCLVGISLGLWRGSLWQRGIKAWLSVMVLLAAWLIVSMQWSSIAWYARGFRMQRHLTDIERFAAQVESSWPESDGSTTELGPFLAYPIGAPETLIMLGETRITDTGLRIKAIERTLDSSLRLELAGSEDGVWLEHRPDKSPPIPFVGGLLQAYTVKRTSPLSRDWHMVRYEIK